MKRQLYQRCLAMVLVLTVIAGISPAVLAADLPEPEEMDLLEEVQESGAAESDAVLQPEAFPSELPTEAPVEVPAETSAETPPEEPEEPTPEAPQEEEPDDEMTAAEPETQSMGEEAEPAEQEPIADYDSFLQHLKELETYAANYAAEDPQQDPGALVINFIRTGVERYTSGTWATLAGAENTAFTAYVAEQDAQNGTGASRLKYLEEMQLPNGNTVDLGHMFGTMDIACYAATQGMTEGVQQARADLGGWAGDTADMMFCAVNADIPDSVDLTETDVDALAEAILSRYLGADYNGLNHVEHSFTATDLYGDMDAYYVMHSYLAGGGSLSSLMENYFTDSLTDAQRADYFLQNRLGGAKTKKDIRAKVLELYTGNALLEALEASYSLTDLENHDRLQQACCYAFADYLFGLAGDDSGETPVEPVDPVDPVDPEKPENPYYTVFSQRSSTLAPGVDQNITYALTTDEKQMVFYTATVDLSREDVHIYANYHGNDGSGWAMSRVTDQMEAARKKHTDPEDVAHYVENYSTVLGINADFYDMSTGVPCGALVMEGTEYHGVGSENFFGILEDGTPIIGGPEEYTQYRDQIWEAVGGSAYLVQNGKSAVTSQTDYYNSRHSRTCVGITADGKVVLMVLDGRQEPFSVGGSAEELAQIMIEAGCETAINLDGGGSSTFAAKQEGEDQVSVVNRPSDGYERSVSSSLLVVSTAEATDTFDHARIDTEADYLTVGASVTLHASGVSANGNAASMPEGVEWALSDETMGSMEDGVFTASKLGDVEVQLWDQGNVVGSKTLHVVVPDQLMFTRKRMDVIYGQKTELPLTATCGGNPVIFCPEDVMVTLGNSAAGTVEGLDFTASAGTGIRNVKVTAMLASDYSISASMVLALYSEDEAKFDFGTAMYGDRNLAWNREVSNATVISDSQDGVLSCIYQIDQPGLPMTASYTFALDMQKVEVPERLVPLLSMVAGGDLENVTAWDILLQLAERVSGKTTVEAKLCFDPNVTVDTSQLKIVNEYFRLEGSQLDPETNTLTLTIGWIKQTEAIPQETANPIVIVSGIQLTPKDNALWDASDCLSVNNTGEISYDIYLGANALYSMACQTSFQQNYGIYPYKEPENVIHPQGGHFANTFCTFTDSYTLDRTVKEGWAERDGGLSYYRDNQPLTGIWLLPGYQDETKAYYYDFGQDGMCTGPLTGLFQKDGSTYYAIGGILMKGWRLIPDDQGNDCYYYFDYGTGAAADGVQTIGGHTYGFEACILKNGAWETDERGIHYFWAGREMQNQWFNVDGKEYFAYANTCAVATGIAKTLNHQRTGEEYYYFDETGVWQKDFTGLVAVGEKTYLIEQGVRKNYPGLFRLNDDLYYINSGYTLIRNRDYYVSRTNGLLPAGKYHFDADGKLVVTPPGERKNGIVKEGDTWYYYVDDVKTYGGLIEMDGAYYYVRSNFEVVHGRSYFVSKTNGLLSQGTYEFDADGKMVINAPEERRNGIVKEGDTWYYYVNDVKTYGGLIEMDGVYYYVRSNFEVVHGRSYFVSKTNGLLPQGTYEFDADGKMVIRAPEERRNGIVKEGDTWYYYVNDVKTYGGLIEMDGVYYYVRSNFEVVHGRSYFVSKTNGLLPQGTYEFDAEGRMIR